jgi:hypothetical protein
MPSPARSPRSWAAEAAGLALAAVVAVAGLAGCSGGLPTRGSGTVVDSAREVEPFDALAVDSAIEVSLAVGAEPAVLVRADDNVQDLVAVQVVDDTLTLDVRGSVIAATLEATVTAPADALTAIALDGASSLTATDEITSPALDVSLGGASRAFLVLAAGSVGLVADGAGVLNAAGTAASLEVIANGASSVQVSELTVATASVDASGASRVHLTVTEQLEATATGGSTVVFGGDPAEVTQDAQDGSTIRAD